MFRERYVDDGLAADGVVVSLSVPQAPAATPSIVTGSAPTSTPSFASAPTSAPPDHWPRIVSPAGVQATNIRSQAAFTRAAVIAASHPEGAGVLRDGFSQSAAERFGRMVDLGPDAVVVHVDGRIVFVNAVAVRWLGARSAAELVGHGIARLLHRTSMPPLTSGMAVLRTPGDASVPVDVRLVRADGSTTHVEAVSVLTSWDGEEAFQTTFRDVTDRRSADDAVAIKAAVVDHVGNPVFTISRTGMVTSWNPAAERTYRRPAQRALARPVREVLGAPLDAREILDAGGAAHAVHFAMDGMARAVRVSVTEVDNGFVITSSDETALREDARRLAAVVHALEEGVLVVEQNGWVLTINPAASRLLGLGDAAGSGELVRRLRALSIHDVDGKPVSWDDAPAARALDTGVSTSGRILGVDHPGGERVWLSVSARLLYPDRPDRSPAVLTFSDITEHRRTAERLAHEASHDSLTGLPNRAHIVERMNSVRRSTQPLGAVLFLDLDDLKSVNDTLGHDVGDTVIRTAADRLRGAVRAEDVVGRLSGDEFVALLVGELDETELRQSVERMHAILVEPIVVAGGTLSVSASIGVVRTVRGDFRNDTDLLREADAAMYDAKARGRRPYHFSVRLPGAI